ncbi:hypothetical protein BH10ACT1_BH10ACT1_35290 [soil metagenome]
MVIACWSVKGGVGTTTVAAAIALGWARSPGPAALLVDLAGDLPACLGVAEPTGPGAAEWLAAGTEVPPDSLARLFVPVTTGLEVLARGTGPLAAARGTVLLQLLAASGRRVVVDCGNIAEGGVGWRFAAEADRSLLVARPCVLGLRRAMAAPLRPSGIVLVRDPGRAFSTADVAGAVGAPVVAELAVDPVVARAVDAGLTRARLPRSFGDALAGLAGAEVRA